MLFVSWHVFGRKIEEALGEREVTIAYFICWEIEKMSSIILIDDEKDLCYSLAKQLRHFFPNLQIRSTTKPLEAKQWLEEERPRLLITDVRMPYISGLELFILVNKRWGFVPTIVMSAYLSKELNEMLSQDKFYFIPKPFRIQDMIQLIEKILADEHLAEADDTLS